MKKLLLLISLTLVSATSFGQWQWNINFDDTTYLSRIIIDTSSIWEVGHPNKTVFTTANSSPNVIATDTLNSYPTNDTSSFTIIHIANIGWSLNYPKVDIGGWYYVNSDTITDHGYIDFSSDHGITWFNLDSAVNNEFCTWGAVQELPTFSGNSNGWKHFYYCLHTTGTVNVGDTILYRFTFVSDSVQTNKDGLMFDDLHFEDWAEGIQEYQNDNLISIYPNPTNENLYIRKTKNNNNSSIEIFDCKGQLVLVNRSFKEESIDTKNLQNGLYLLKYSDTKNYSVKRFVVQH